MSSKYINTKWDYIFNQAAYLQTIIQNKNTAKADPDWFELYFTRCEMRRQQSQCHWCFETEKLTKRKGDTNTQENYHDHLITWDNHLNSNLPKHDLIESIKILPLKLNKRIKNAYLTMVFFTGNAPRVSYSTKTAGIYFKLLTHASRFFNNAADTIMISFFQKECLAPAHYTST